MEPRTVEDKYRAKQQELIYRFEDPLRTLLIQRALWQQDIADLMGQPGREGEIEALKRLLRDLNAQILAHPQGQRYFAEEEGLKRNFKAETGGFAAVPPQPPPPPSAPPGPGQVTWGQPLQGAPPPPPGQAWAPHPGPAPAGPGYGSRSGAGGFTDTGPIPRSGTGPRPRQTGPMPRAGYQPPPGAPRRQGRPGGRQAATPPPRGGQPAGQPPRRPQRPGYPGGPRGLPPAGRPGPGGVAVRTRIQPPPMGARQGRKRAQTALLVVVAIAVIALLVRTVHTGGSGYPGNVNQVKSWISTACQNKNTLPTGSNVQFACSTQGRNILWVFALMSSGANPDYVGKMPTQQEQQKGAKQRFGLMPVPAGVGTLYASSLDLGHVYSPIPPKQYQSDPRYVNQAAVDSLEVAALALNVDLGGTVAYGSVQQGLEGNKNGPANCQRYTGSSAQTTLTSGLVVCAKPMTPNGQLAAVEDLWLQWDIPGSDQNSQTLAKNAAKVAASLYRSPNTPDADAQNALRWINTEHAANQLLV